MIIRDFKGYKEGQDVTLVPLTNLVYPSENVLVQKGKIYTRGGLVNDGVEATTDTKVHSEFVWKDAPGGQRFLRFYGQNVQVKYNEKWYTIFSSLSATTTRVICATWTDGNGAIFKKRLFFVDGSTTLYSWNGAIEVVESYTADTITLDITGTALQKGFDVGTANNQTVIVYSLDGSGEVDDTSEYVYDNDASGDTLELMSTPSPVPVAGDVVIAKPVVVADKIGSEVPLDFIYTFKNHVIVGNYNSSALYWSHIEYYHLTTLLNFTVPTAGSRTALTAIYMKLDGNITAMIGKRDTLYISDANDWYKVTKKLEEDVYGLLIDVQKLETPDSKGALPWATALYGYDIVYLAQDLTLNRIQSLEISGLDDLQLLSDDISGYLNRIDTTDVRLYFFERAIYMLFPNDSQIMLLDTVEGYFQPPQRIPANCLSMVNNVIYGHHNAENQTFRIFSGRSDFDSAITAKIKFGLHDNGNLYYYKKATKMGMSLRITNTTRVNLIHGFEANNDKGANNITFKGSDVKKMGGVGDDVSWGTNPYGSRSWGGADMDTQDLERAIAFTKLNASFFESDIYFQIDAEEEEAAGEFHLMGIFIDEKTSDIQIGNNFFINK